MHDLFPNYTIFVKKKVMQQIELALKGTLGNLISSSVPLITAPGDEFSNPLVTAVVQLVIAIATVISLFKKRQKDGKN